MENLGQIYDIMCIVLRRGYKGKMILLRDLSIFWGMFHVIFLFIMLFRSRFAKKKTILAAESMC